MKPGKHRSLKKKKKPEGILEPNHLLALSRNVQEKILAGRRASEVEDTKIKMIILHTLGAERKTTQREETES